MRWVLAWLYAVATAVLVGTLAGFLGHGLGRGSAMAALGCGVLVGVASLWAARKQPRTSWKLEPWGTAALVVFALFALRSFLWYAFYVGDGLMVFSPNNLGDFALHLSYVRYLAAGAPFWPENPIFAGAPLTYPVGVDLLNSLLLLVGVEELKGFVWVGLMASAATAAMLWRWGRGFAVAGFLFAGGTLGFEILRRHSLVDFQSDAAWSKEGLIVAWKSLPLALFVTQRGLLFAIPSGLALLASWRSRFVEPEREGERLPLWGEWLLYAAMPIFHLHTFLFLSFIAAAWFIAIPEGRWHLFRIVAAAVVPASLLVWLVTGRFAGASMLGWHPGWMQEDQNFLVFWLTNFGFWIPATLWLLVELVRRKNPERALEVVVPAGVVFLTCCFVKFAKWEWDNTKLMIWSYLLVLPAIARHLGDRLPDWARGVGCVLLFFSGAASLLGGLSGNSIYGSEEDLGRVQEAVGYRVASRGEIDGVLRAVQAIPVTDRVVGYPNFNHPVLLSGRTMAMGYEGHVWSHGIDFRERKAAVETIMKGDDGWRDTAARIGVRWLFWGEQEKQNYEESTQPWKAECRRVAVGTWGAIYDLQSPAERSEAPE